MLHEISFRQTKCRMKFRSAKRNVTRNFAARHEMLPEISLPQTKFRTKCHAKFRASARNCDNIGTIVALTFHRNIAENSPRSKYRSISSNFVEIRRNSLSLFLHSTVLWQYISTDSRLMTHCKLKDERDQMC